MKRKIVRQGGSALTITLPFKWAKKYHLDAGREVDITEEGHTLIINAKGTTKLNKLDIDADGLCTMLNRIIGAGYKAGYDEIEVRYTTPEELAEIQTVVGRTCIGFEIVEQTKNKVLIKSLSKLEIEEFELVLRRCFLSLLSMAEDSLEYIKKQDAVGMKNVVLRDDYINKYSDFCRRVLNSSGGYVTYKRIPPVYFIVEQLEKIGDMYKDLCRELSENPASLSEKTLKLYAEVNSFLRDFYELFYKFDLASVEEFGKKRNRIKKMFKASFDDINIKEAKVLFYLDNVFESTFDMNGSLLTMNI